MTNEYSQLRSPKKGRRRSLSPALGVILSTRNELSSTVVMAHDGFCMQQKQDEHSQVLIETTVQCLVMVRPSKCKRSACNPIEAMHNLVLLWQ